MKRAIKSFDNVTETTRALETKLATLSALSEEFREVKQDVKKALIAAERVKGLEDQIAVLQRDQRSIWRTIDELKGTKYGRHLTSDTGRGRD